MDITSSKIKKAFATPGTAFKSHARAANPTLALMILVPVSAAALASETIILLSDLTLQHVEIVRHMLIM